MDLVDTTAGPVRGIRHADTLRFLGIPYAKPPIGRLRFAPPEPPEPWTEPLDASRFGPTAQRRSLTEDAPTTIPEPSVPGDGVLNLNVYTPADRAGELLPVMVWIHGGGFVAGSAASPWYDGASFNRDGVVVVTLGYRLGIEGFLHLDDAADNRAVADWVAALRWVHANIAAFGGDPAEVTIAGQSAGGTAVQTLLATPSAAGLFRAAISMSGAALRVEGLEQASRVSAEFRSITGLPATSEALARLQTAELDAAQHALVMSGGTFPRLVLGPLVDGVLVPKPLLEAIAHGSAAPAPLLLGFTSHEFNGAAPAEATVQQLDAFLEGAGLDTSARDAFIGRSPSATPAQRIGQALTDVTFRAQGLAVAEARSVAALPTWLYQFGWTSPVPGFHAQAVHCIDIPFAFDLLDADRVADVAGEAPPRSLADAVHGSWVRFIRDLDPGPDWPPYTRESRFTMMFDEQPRVAHDPLEWERRVWLDGRRPARTPPADRGAVLSG